MIFIWLVLALMTLATALMLSVPLFDTRKIKNEIVFALEVYRDQIQELNRDAAAGLIAPDQARLAQIEIERRILALTESPQWKPARAPSPALLIVSAVVLPLLGFGLYLLLGSPALPAQPFAHEQTAASTPEIERLREAVASRPNDAQAWVALAAGFDAAALPRDAATAYGKAVALGAADSDTLAAYGQALVVAGNGEMTEAANATFRRALAADPSNPVARFFLALGRAQAADLEGALADWMALEKETPVDAPWRQTLLEHIARVSQRLGRPAPSSPAPSSPAPSGSAPSTEGAPSPSEADIAAAAGLSPEARAAMVNDMVARLAERLAAEPEDLEGWVRLARAYQVLEQRDESRAAWAKAAALAPGRLDIQLDYANAIIAGRDDVDRYLPPEFLATVGRVRTLDANNPLGLYYGGLVARLAGDRDEARRLWQQVLDQLPAEAPQRAILQRELDSLLPAPSR